MDVLSSSPNNGNVGSLRVRCASITLTNTNIKQSDRLLRKTNSTDTNNENIVINNVNIKNKNSKHCQTYEQQKFSSEVWLCTSVMSPETKRCVPPTTDTIQTKPFPIRGK